MRLHVGLAALTGCFAIPLGVTAEEREGGRAQRTAVYMQAGYSSGVSNMGGATLGGMLVHDLTSRLSVEGSASYLGHGMGSGGLGASAAVLVHLRTKREKAVPYLVAGGGLYRASFDMDNGRFNGPMNMGGSMNGSGMMGRAPLPAGTGWDYGQMPHFYGRRLEDGGRNQGPMSGRRSFTDPSISLGGGIRIDLGSRLYLRPDARALIVTSRGDSDTLGMFTVNFGYRF